MKIIFLLITFYCFTDIAGQRISYTNRTIRMGLDDAVIVVPDVGGKKHLLLVPEAGLVRLVIYGKDMDLESELELPFRVSKKSNITILPIRNYYYLYNEANGRQAALYSISAAGKVTNVTGTLNDIVRKSFSDTTVTCQLFSSRDTVYLLGNLYYPKLKKVITTIVQLNDKLEQQARSRLGFDFDYGNETIERMVLVPGSNLTVLKRTRSEDGEHLLNVVQVSMKTGQEQYSSFNSNVAFSSPDILYNPTDSSTTIHAYVGRSYQGSTLHRNLFLAKLHNSFTDTAFTSVLRYPIENEMYGVFTNIHVNAHCNKWIPVHGVWNMPYQQRTASRLFIGLTALVSNANEAYLVNATSYKPKLEGVDASQQFVAPPGNIRFSVLNNNFRAVADTVIKYRRKNFIEASQYASFTMNNNNYLVVKEQFPSNGKSLLLLNTDKQGTILSSPIPVYHKYHYALPHIQRAGTNLICPYIHKGEIGLVNINIERNG